MRQQLLLDPLPILLRRVHHVAEIIEESQTIRSGGGVIIVPLDHFPVGFRLQLVFTRPLLRGLPGFRIRKELPVLYAQERIRVGMAPVVRVARLARIVHVLTVSLECPWLHDRRETRHHRIEAVAPVLVIAHLVLADVEVFHDVLRRLRRLRLIRRTGREAPHRPERRLILPGVADEKALDLADEGVLGARLEPRRQTSPALPGDLGGALLRLLVVLFSEFVNAAERPAARFLFLAQKFADLPSGQRLCHGPEDVGAFDPPGHLLRLFAALIMEER